MAGMLLLGMLEFGGGRKRGERWIGVFLGSSWSLKGEMGGLIRGLIAGVCGVNG